MCPGNTSPGRNFQVWMKLWNVSGQDSLLSAVVSSEAYGNTTVHSRFKSVNVKVWSQLFSNSHNHTQIEVKTKIVSDQIVPDKSDLRSSQPRHKIDPTILRSTVRVRSKSLESHLWSVLLKCDQNLLWSDSSTLENAYHQTQLRLDEIKHEQIS